MLILRPVLHTRKKSNGTQIVRICLYQSGLPRRFVSTGLAVTEAHWNEKGEIGKLNWVRASRSSHIEDNLAIAEQIKTLRDLSLTHDTPAAILKALEAKAVEQNIVEEKEERCFKDYWRQYINDTAHRWGVHWKPKQESSLNTFTTFNPGRLPFADLTSQLLKKYEKWHVVKQGNTQTTAGKELSQVRAVVNAAIRDQLISAAENPFALFSIKHGTGQRRTLSWEDIHLIERAHVIHPEAQRSRDVFLFQFYAGGRRINEILPLTWEDIQAEHFVYSELKHGGKRVRKRRQLNDELKAILSRYEHRKALGEPFVFPVFSKKDDLSKRTVLNSGTSSINNGLYQIARQLNLLSFSSHVARHTWADLARKAGVDMYAISKNLGHSRLAVTENYVEAFDQEAVEAGNQVMIASRPKS